MRILFLALSLGFVLPLLAQNEQEVSSEITAVTIFEQGAQITRTGQASLRSGQSELIFTDIPPGLDERSLRFSADGDLNVISVNYEVRFDESTTAEKAEQANLNKKLKQLTEEVRGRRDLLEVRAQERKTLLENTDFDMWEGMNVTQLQQGVDLVRSRLTTIKEAVQQLESDIEMLNEQRQKTLNQLQEKRIQQAKPRGTAVVKIAASRSQQVDLELNYVLPEAGWRPFYDFKVEDLDSPMKILYNAKVYQNTGENWKDVDITLSTGNPGESGELPVLNRWVLNFISGSYYQSRSANIGRARGGGITGVIKGQVLDVSTQEAIPFANVIAKNSQGVIVKGTTSDIDGNFKLELSEKATQLMVSFVGYQTQYMGLSSNSRFYTVSMSEQSQQLNEVQIIADEPMEMAVRDIQSISSQAAGVTRSKSQAVSVSQNPVNLNFDVDIPYSIPSNGEEYRVELEEYSVDANYLYQAVPKLNEHAFLTAQIEDWEKLMLMDGEAGIYLEGTYLGQTQLNASTASDTLELSLGKDQNIAIQRNTVEEKEGTKFLSGKISKRNHYQIIVRNNRDEAVTLEVKDQFPISGNEQIEVDRIDHSGGKVEDKSGIITWELELEPGDEEKLDLIYEVTYPKRKMINLRDKY